MSPVAIHDDESDWSDSSDEEDARSDVETNVLLGIPDGEIKTQGDIDDAAVSRIGGRPAFLSKEDPSISSSRCKNCSYPMELLVQLWCPFEESVMDRALYIFGCARGECQHKAGSIRAFRGLRYNASYATKLEKKRARQQEKEASRAKALLEEEKRKQAVKVNPFSMNSAPTKSSGLFGGPPNFGAGAGAGGFGLGSQLFGASNEEHQHETQSDAEAPPASNPESEDESEASDSESEGDADADADATPPLLSAPAHSPDASSPWLSAPAYTPPLYMSTAYEYVPPAPRQKIPQDALDSSAVGGQFDESILDGPAKSKKGETKREKDAEKDAKAWDSAMEGYEDSLELDKVFEKFAKIAGYEGEQCIRYELGGTPLPYSHDKIFTSLFPSPSSSTSTASSTYTSNTNKFAPATQQPARRIYNSSSPTISPCPLCGGPRTFECQLMPNLISVLQSKRSSVTGDSESKPSEEKEKQGEQKDTAKTETEIGGPGEPDEPEEITPARKEEVERLLKRQGDDKRGMEWGTCMVFSCAKDCYGTKPSPSPSPEKKDLWTEELVLVQWEE